MKLKLILMLFLALTAATVSQITAQSAPATAPPIRSTADVSDDLKDCASQLAEASQFLDQSLAEVKAAKSLIESLKAENESRKSLADIQKGVIENQQRLIDLMTKQNRRRISFAFGLIKITY